MLSLLFPQCCYTCLSMQVMHSTSRYTQSKRILDRNVIFIVAFDIYDNCPWSRGSFFLFTFRRVDNLIWYCVLQSIFNWITRGFLHHDNRYVRVEKNCNNQFRRPESIIKFSLGVSAGFSSDCQGNPYIIQIRCHNFRSWFSASGHTGYSSSSQEAFT